ncbi:vanin-like protein 3 isoform X2 [Anastrepha obliqua]|uniref:vanin-like protein 3 isoform X2 n=1 Tax=Anastrepha obliqua TaxID=95512 RepID=UPI00240A9953|nr:vanin-like protein 3 isoform X2 [Anastrepha obliqua]
MAKKFINIFVSVLLVIMLQSVTNQASNINDPYFVGGVVEFRPDFVGLTAAELIAKHTAAYIEILESPEALDTDIVVFPEGTLNNEFQPTYVPAPEGAVIPCLLANQTNHYETFLVQLSCSARANRKYVVINLNEKENCTDNAAFDPRPCATNGLNMYNTNVVFDREGRVISRYRKFNIYLERKNTTYQPEFAIFDTDFGVRFAHFICFDLLFYTPAEELVDKYGIRNIIFTSMFYSETPFLTAIQLQQSWAWGNNVTLLAAGGSYPMAGATGSGIYAGSGGSLSTAMIGTIGVRQLLVAKVPKFGNESSPQVTRTRQFADVSATPQTGIKLLRDPQLDNFNSVLLPLTPSTAISVEQCAEDLCCTLTGETTTSKNSYGNGTATGAYRYRFGVFTGQRTYEKEQYSSVAICALYACTNETVSSCGLLFAANTTIVPEIAFTRLNIAGSFKKTERLLVMPNTLDLSLYSLQPEQVDWEFADKGNSYAASIDLKASADNLLAFGIYANYYDSSSAPKYGGSMAMLVTCLWLWTSIYVIDFLHKRFFSLKFVCNN